MTNLKRSLVTAFTVLAVLTILVGLGQATIISVTLKGGEELNHPVNLIVEDRVLIQYNIVGGSATDMHFSMSFPNGTVKDFGSSGDFSYSFVSDVEGECMLNFVNTGEAEILLTLDYEIDHYVFGMPQMLFMVILIVVVSLVGVAVFIGLSRKPY